MCLESDSVCVWSCDVSFFYSIALWFLFWCHQTDMNDESKQSIYHGLSVHKGFWMSPESSSAQQPQFSIWNENSMWLQSRLHWSVANNIYILNFAVISWLCYLHEKIKIKIEQCKRWRIIEEKAGYWNWPARLRAKLRTAIVWCSVPKADLSWINEAVW